MTRSTSGPPAEDTPPPFSVHKHTRNTHPHLQKLMIILKALILKLVIAAAAGWTMLALL